jgi:hypothetical protein
MRRDTACCCTQCCFKSTCTSCTPCLLVHNNTHTQLKARSATVLLALLTASVALLTQSISQRRHVTLWLKSAHALLATSSMLLHLLGLRQASANVSHIPLAPKLCSSVCTHALGVLLLVVFHESALAYVIYIYV